MSTSNPLDWWALIIESNVDEQIIDNIVDEKQHRLISDIESTILFIYLFWDKRPIGQHQSTGGSSPPGKFYVKYRGDIESTIVLPL